MAEAKKVVGKIKKKMWYEIIAPKIFRNVPLGETLVVDKEKLMGREITISLANITGDMKRQSTIIRFKVIELKEDKAITDIIGYSILLTHIKRMIRKGRKKVDDSFVCKTKDGKLVKIKVVLITRCSAKNQVLTGLRKVGKEILINNIKNVSYSNLINDVISYNLQRSLKEQLKKIFPLKICEIRHISLAKEKKEEVKEEPKVEEKKEVPKEVPKEEPKTTPKETAEQKDKEEKKEEVKESPKVEEKKEEPKEVPKEEPKTTAEQKDKEEVKESPKEEPKTASTQKETEEQKGESVLEKEKKGEDKNAKTDN